MSPEQWRDFIDSFEPEKGLPEEMHGISLNTSLSLADIGMACRVNMGKLTDRQCAEYWKERATRAESRQIPDLKEKVKSFGRDCLASHYKSDMSFSKLRALCKPDKDSKEVKP